MPDLADIFNASRRRRNQTDDTVQALENEVADLKQRLATSEALVLQLRNDLETLNIPPTNLHTSELARLREAIVDSTAQANQLHQRYDHLCRVFAERSAQLSDLRICIAEMREQAAARTTTLEASLISYLEVYKLMIHIQEIIKESQARANGIEKAQQRLSLAEQRTLELRTQLRVAKKEGESKDNRIRQKGERLSLASQRALDLRHQLRVVEEQGKAKGIKILELEHRLELDRRYFVSNLEAQNRQKDMELYAARMMMLEEKNKRISLEANIKYKDNRIKGLEERLDKRQANIKYKDNRIKDLEERLDGQQAFSVGKLRQLFIRPLIGKIVVLRDVPIDITIVALKDMVAGETGVSTCTQRLIYGSKELLKDSKDAIGIVVFMTLVNELTRVLLLLDCTLRVYGIGDGATIRLVARLVEGKFNQNPSDGKLRQLVIRELDGTTVTLCDVPIDATVAAFKEMVAVKTGISTCERRFIYAGRQLDDNCTLRGYGIGDGATIHLLLRLVGGKPVITLYPPSRQRTTVTLGLCTGLEFIYLHPKPTNGTPPSKVKTLREAEWEVEVGPDGGITTLDTARQQVSYLFWEAFFSQCREIDISVSRHEPSKIFVISIDDLPPFLDDFMERCGFPVKEKQDMITYWAPQLSNSEYVAIKFLKPEEYHILAPLTVNPPPDRLVRLFALFKGMGERAALEWQELVLADVEEQVGIVLQGKERPTVGAGEFCAFEWGGMIV